MTRSTAALAARGLSVGYRDHVVIDGLDLSIAAGRVTALCGPNGCGKSTLLRTLNRMNDIIPGTHVSGHVLLAGRGIYGPDVDVVELRRRVGMVFQKSNPFPKSIFENVAYGLRINRLARHQYIEFHHR